MVFASLCCFPSFLLTRRSGGLSVYIDSILLIILTGLIYRGNASTAHNDTIIFSRWQYYYKKFVLVIERNAFDNASVVGVPISRVDILQYSKLSCVTYNLSTAVLTPLKARVRSLIHTNTQPTHHPLPPSQHTTLHSIFSMICTESNWPFDRSKRFRELIGST